MPPPLPPAICPRCAAAGKPGVVHRDREPCSTPLPRPALPKPGASPKRETSAEQRAREAWAAAAAEQEEKERAEKEAEDARRSFVKKTIADASADPGDRWALARQEAAAIDPGHIGTLLWIDVRCQKAGMHPLDPWWVETLRTFYKTGKLVLAARVGLRGAKSVTICRSLVNDALFTVRNLDPSAVGVIPIMSADRTEATDRFHTIIAILRACGVASSKKGEDEMMKESPTGLGMTYTSTTLPSGGGVIKVKDSQEHDIEFRIYPARISAAIGYTAVAGFCDEVDQWPVDLGLNPDDVAQKSDDGRANPGDVVLDRLLERFTTSVANAKRAGLIMPHLYIVSASYRGEDSAHHRKIVEKCAPCDGNGSVRGQPCAACGGAGKGDTSIQMVARLGAMGAARDTAARRALASAIGSDDPRLLAEADPRSTDIGAWVCNPASPIDTCYDLSRSRIGPMLGRYGGRPDESGAGGIFAAFALPEDERAFEPVDVVMGVAPPALGEKMWGRVVVGIDARGLLHVLHDLSGSDPFDPCRYGYSLVAQPGASVLAVAVPCADILAAYLSAAYMGGIAMPAPVAPIDVYDGQALRVTHLAALYERGRLTHGPAQDALRADLRRFTGEARVHRVEALAAAVARLVACYPWLGAEGSAEPIRGPRAVDGMHAGGADGAREMLRRLGARE